MLDLLRTIEERAMGPKNPAKIASLNVLISGMNLYRASMAGNLLMRRTAIPSTANRQAFKVSIAFSKSENGIVAPM